MQSDWEKLKLRYKEFSTIVNIKTRNYKLIEILKDEGIILNYQLTDNYYDNIKNILIELNNYNKKDIECNYSGCNNETKFYGLSKYTKSGTNKNGVTSVLGFKPFCSNTCKHLWWSERQKLNNTSLRMTEESRKISYEKLSIALKRKIANGEWTPNITNSWTGSKVSLNINGKIINYRSSWEAFFHLCYQHLEYEKTRIPYTYNDKKHSYITDFTDVSYNIIYEIKPDKLKLKEKNLVKFTEARRWCKKHNYTFIVISNDWFKENFNKYEYLLENQKDQAIIKTRLKQFTK